MKSKRNLQEFWLTLFPLQVGDILEMKIRKNINSPYKKVRVKLIGFTLENDYPFHGIIISKGDSYRESILFAKKHIIRVVRKWNSQKIK